MCGDGPSFTQHERCLLQQPHARPEPTSDSPNQRKTHRDAAGSAGEQQPTRSPKRRLDHTFAHSNRDRPAMARCGIGVDKLHTIRGGFFDDTFRCALHRFAPPLARRGAHARAFGINQTGDEDPMAIDNGREPIRRIILLPQHRA